MIKHTLCGVPVPRMLWPRIETRESAADGAYTFLADARSFIGALLPRGFHAPPKPALASIDRGDKHQSQHRAEAGRDAVVLQL